MKPLKALSDGFKTLGEILVLVMTWPVGIKTTQVDASTGLLNYWPEPEPEEPEAILVPQEDFDKLSEEALKLVSEVEWLRQVTDASKQKEESAAEEIRKLKSELAECMNERNSYRGRYERSLLRPPSVQRERETVSFQGPYGTVIYGSRFKSDDGLAFDLNPFKEKKAEPAKERNPLMSF